MFNVKKIMDLPEDFSPTDKNIDMLANLFVVKWYNKPWRWVKRQLANIVRVFKWLPLIWKDREWDHAYLEDILLFKLKNMRDYYRAGINVWSAGADRTADEIDEVIELLEKVRADNYEETIDPHFNDWIYEERPLSKDVIDENGNTHHMFNSPEWSKEELKRRQEVYAEAARQTEADLDKAYGLIAKNIRKWWD